MIVSSQLIKCVISGQNGKKCQMTEYIDIALSDLVFFLNQAGWTSGHEYWKYCQWLVFLSCATMNNSDKSKTDTNDHKQF